MMGWYHDGTSWGGWLVMAATMVVFWGLVIFAVYMIFRGGQATPSAERTAHRDPLEILDERFARGEIDAEEYHARQDVLRGAVH